MLSEIKFSNMNQLDYVSEGTQFYNLCELSIGLGNNHQ